LRESFIILKRSRFRRKNAAAFLFFAVALSSSFKAEAATYDVALKEALVKADVNVCDTISESPCPEHPQFSLDGERGISVEQLQETCRIRVIAAQGQLEGCMKLDNQRHSTNSESMRGRCLESMALSLKRADICAMIPAEEESTQEKMAHAECRVASLFSGRIVRKGIRRT
jgi:hypothetical protein